MKKCYTVISVLILVFGLLQLTACSDDNDPTGDDSSSSTSSSTSSSASSSSSSSAPPPVVYPIGWTEVVSDDFTGAFLTNVGETWEATGASGIGAGCSAWVGSGVCVIEGDAQSFLGNIKLADADAEGVAIVEVASLSNQFEHTGGEWNVRARFYDATNAAFFGFIELNLQPSTWVIRASYPGAGFGNTETRITCFQLDDLKFRIHRHADGNVSVAGWDGVNMYWQSVVTNEAWSSGTAYLQVFVTDITGNYASPRIVSFDKISTWVP